MSDFDTYVETHDGLLAAALALAQDNESGCNSTANLALVRQVGKNLIMFMDAFLSR